MQLECDDLLHWQGVFRLSCGLSMGGAQSQATSGGLPSLCWVILGYYAFLIKITYFMVYPPFLPGLHTVIAYQSYIFKKLHMTISLTHLFKEKDVSKLPRAFVMLLVKKRSYVQCTTISYTEEENKRYHTKQFIKLPSALSKVPIVLGSNDFPPEPAKVTLQ